MAEMRVETEIVTANWRKNCPVIPPRKQIRYEYGTEGERNGYNAPGDLPLL